MVVLVSWLFRLPLNDLLILGKARGLMVAGRDYSILGAARDKNHACKSSQHLVSRGCSHAAQLQLQP
jgi:hypothetical protein